MIAPPIAQSYAQHLIAGIQTAARECALDLIIADKITSDSASLDVIAYVHQTLVDNPAIDAIITASTSSAMAAVAGLEAHGAAVGREIDLFTKEAMPFLRLFRADILTVGEQVDVAGAFLAKAAMQAISHPSAPPMQCLEVPSDDNP